MIERLFNLRVTEKAIHRMRRNFEYTRVRAACEGFVLSDAQDEHDRLEHGRPLAWDPDDDFTGHSWLYRGEQVAVTR